LVLVEEKVSTISMKILVTGSAGFIGAALTKRLLENGKSVVGIDNHNDYYDKNLKEARLAEFIDHPNYQHERIDISNATSLSKVFKNHDFNVVVNLAAQAGVRYSIENPSAYVDSNLVGFANILESVKNSEVDHLVYASSSSVYGSNSKIPFSTEDNVDHPVSFYAATKKANELMAHSYSHLFNIRTTGLRFFTVYGPWDRPDMALQTFSRSILSGETIKVFNHGNHMRDFTFIDDIVAGLLKVIEGKLVKKLDPKKKNTSSIHWKVYNIGNSNPVNLIDYISQLESEFGIIANKEFLPMQPGDMKDTFADVEDLVNDFGYKPETSVQEGIARFVNWYKDYFKI
jgi:UDP-glucuronate 4-epimerase